MFKAYSKNENDVIDVVLVFLLLTLNIFYTFFSVSIVYFEQVNVSCAGFFRRCSFHEIKNGNCFDNLSNSRLTL